MCQQHSQHNVPYVCRGHAAKALRDGLLGPERHLGHPVRQRRCHRRENGGSKFHERPLDTRGLSTRTKRARDHHVIISL
jgi:hypothetical protein